MVRDAEHDEENDHEGQFRKKMGQKSRKLFLFSALGLV
jgi:hypothetical protein